MEGKSEDFDELGSSSDEDDDQEQPRSTGATAPTSSQTGRGRHARFTEEERRNRRRTANRESARRMRAKRSEAMCLLQESVAQLADHNKQLQNANKSILKRLERIEAENKLLRQQARGRATLGKQGSGDAASAGWAEDLQTPGDSGSLGGAHPAKKRRVITVDGAAAAAVAASGSGGAGARSSSLVHKQHTSHVSTGGDAAGLSCLTTGSGQGRAAATVKTEAVAAAAGRNGSASGAANGLEVPGGLGRPPSSSLHQLSRPGTPTGGSGPIRFPSDTAQQHQQLLEDLQLRPPNTAGHVSSSMAPRSAGASMPLDVFAAAQPQHHYHRADVQRHLRHSSRPAGSRGEPLGSVASAPCYSHCASVAHSGDLGMSAAAAAAGGGAVATHRSSSWCQPTAAAAGAAATATDGMSVRKRRSWSPTDLLLGDAELDSPQQQQRPLTSGIDSPVYDPAAAAAVASGAARPHTQQQPSSPMLPGVDFPGPDDDWAARAELLDILLNPQPAAVAPGAASDLELLDAAVPLGPCSAALALPVQPAPPLLPQQHEQAPPAPAAAGTAAAAPRVVGAAAQPDGVPAAAAAAPVVAQGGASAGAEIMQQQDVVGGLAQRLSDLPAPGAPTPPPVPAHQVQPAGIAVDAAGADGMGIGRPAPAVGMPATLPPPPAAATVPPPPASAAAAAAVLVGSGPPVVPALTANDVFSKRPQGLPAGFSSLPWSMPAAVVPLGPGGLPIAAAAATGAAASGSPMPSGAPADARDKARSPEDGGLKAACNAYAALHAAWAADVHGMAPAQAAVPGAATQSGSGAAGLMAAAAAAGSAAGGTATPAAGGAGMPVACSLPASAAVGDVVGPQSGPIPGLLVPLAGQPMPLEMDPLERWAAQHAIGNKGDLLDQVSNLLNVAVPPAPSGLYGSSSQGTARRRYPLKRPSRITMVGSTGLTGSDGLARTLSVSAAGSAAAAAAAAAALHRRGHHHHHRSGSSAAAAAAADGSGSGHQRGRPGHHHHHQRSSSGRPSGHAGGLGAASGSVAGSSGHDSHASRPWEAAALSYLQQSSGQVSRKSGRGSGDGSPTEMFMGGDHQVPSPTQQQGGSADEGSAGGRAELMLPPPLPAAAVSQVAAAGAPPAPMAAPAAHADLRPQARQQPEQQQWQQHRSVRPRLRAVPAVSDVLGLSMAMSGTADGCRSFASDPGPLHPEPSVSHAQGCAMDWQAGEALHCTAAQCLPTSLDAAATAAAAGPVARADSASPGCGSGDVIGRLVQQQPAVADAPDLLATLGALIKQEQHVGLPGAAGALQSSMPRHLQPGQQQLLSMGAVEAGCAEAPPMDALLTSMGLSVDDDMVKSAAAAAAAAEDDAEQQVLPAWQQQQQALLQQQLLQQHVWAQQQQWQHLMLLGHAAGIDSHGVPVGCMPPVLQSAAGMYQSSSSSNGNMAPSQTALPGSLLSTPRPPVADDSATPALLPLSADGGLRLQPGPSWLSEATAAAAAAGSVVGHSSPQGMLPGYPASLGLDYGPLAPAIELNLSSLGLPSYMPVPYLGPYLGQEWEQLPLLAQQQLQQGSAAMTGPVLGQPMGSSALLAMGQDRYLESQHQQSAGVSGSAMDTIQRLLSTSCPTGTPGGSASAGSGSAGHGIVHLGGGGSFRPFKPAAESGALRASDTQQQQQQGGQEQAEVVN